MYTYASVNEYFKEDKSIKDIQTGSQVLYSICHPWQQISISRGDRNFYLATETFIILVQISINFSLKHVFYKN